MTRGTFLRNQRIRAVVQSSGTWQVIGLSSPVLLGLFLGAVIVLSKRLPPAWAGLVVLAPIAPLAIILAKDIRKLVLVLFVIDIPLGFDLSLAHRPEHRAGPGGIVISLMSFALVLGYAHWLAKKPGADDSRMRVVPGIAIPALAFTFATVVSSWQATEIWFSIVQVILQLQLLLMFLYVALQVKSWADARLMLNALAICVILVSLLIFLQLAFGVEFSAFGISTHYAVSSVAGIPRRPGGTFYGPNHAATFLAASAVLFFAAYLTNGRLLNKTLALTAFTAGVLALVATQSRSAWIAFAMGLAIVTARAMARKIGSRRLFLALAVLGLIGLGASTLIAGRIATEDSGSGQSRILHSVMALNMIQDHMFGGVGANNQRFIIDSGEYTPPELWGKEEEISGIHNTYLATWVETGIFGFLSFVWLLLGGVGAAFLASVRARDGYVSIILASLAAALTIPMIHMATATFTSRRVQLTWLLLALISATVQIARNTDNVDDPMLHGDQQESP